MRFALSFLVAAALPITGAAQTTGDIISDVVMGHILPGYAELVEETAALASVAETSCQPGEAPLEAAYHGAFDAWMAVSHITFGPAEADGRYFALSFWPDTRGMTGRGLSELIADEDPVVQDPDDYATVSIAARGFFALDFLLFDPAVSQAGDAAYRCALVQAITTDIATTAFAVFSDWGTEFGDLMLSAVTNERFQTPDEATRVLFSALTTGLEFNADLRLGRPLGSFDAPRPNRAEARRSGRSLRNVEVSLTALSGLAHALSAGDPTLQEDIAQAFQAAFDRIATLDDPVFAGVSDPQGRLRVEALQQRIQDIRTLVSTELGPSLGVAAGFNSLDGD